MIEPSELDNIEYEGSYIVGEMKHNSPALRYIRKDTKVGFFDGVTTFLQYLRDKLPEPLDYDYQSSLKTDNRTPGFNAFETYDEAIDTFLNDPSKVSQFQPKELFITDVIERGKDVQYDVTGDFIDMGRHLEGVPEEFGSLYDGAVRNRRCTIVIGLNQVWNLSHQDIQHRGRRILRLVDALEATQVRTSIKGISSTECEHLEIVLKRHDQPLSITDLGVVSHPEFLRRAIFRFKEHSKTIEGGYGSSVVMNNAIEKNAQLISDENNDELVVWIEGNMQGSRDIDSAFDEAEKLLRVELAKEIPEVNIMTIKTDRIDIHGDGDMGAVRAALEEGARQAE